MATLNPKQARFVAEYLIDLNATQAATRAGYSPNTAGSQGHDLLKKPEIAAAIEAAQAKRADRVQVDAEWVLTRLMKVADRHGDEPAAATRALDLLGRHLGLFPNRHEIAGDKDNPVKLELADAAFRRFAAALDDAAARKAGEGA